MTGPQLHSALSVESMDAISVDTEDTHMSYLDLRVNDTNSLRSSILSYKWQHGRRYHAYHDGAYWGPNDEKQQDAEDLMHELFRIVLDGKLHDLPVNNFGIVLDVGCGTGIWAMEFADEYPSSDVVGIDLSPIQPNLVPPNCHFEVDDVNTHWTFPEDHFDFVHVRGMSGSVPDWVEFHKKAFRHLKPGGWVEHVEISCITKSDDGTIKQGSALVTWVELFTKIGAALGKTFFACEEASAAIQHAGFVNIHERRVKLPIGTWPKDQHLKHWGAWNRQFLVQGLEGFSIRGMTDLLEWSYEEAQVFLAQMRKELVDPKVHAYVEMCIVRGQRPN
ncbi:S-adenosyl-L-methionine-dependent methyltransferase [Mariannaea sp. PMI_226]|nr:S-adenosyl-L-methionine-dependent methyltransferase [Mariannaea sp. PMI_226]